MAQRPDHPLLQRPLYVFDLPEEILATIALKSQSTQPAQETPPPVDTPAESEKSDTESTAPSKATSCNLCNLSFPSVSEQRNHVRSDLHGYNLKQKIKGLPPVSEADFEKLIGDLDESISGSESEESDESDAEADGKGKESTLSALLKKQAKISNPEFDDFTSNKKQRGAGTPPMLWFTSPSLPENTSLGIYRAIFSNAEQEEEAHIVSSLKSKQLAPKLPPKIKSDTGLPPPETDVGPHYFLCMIGGGHFAAMIVALSPKKGKSHTGGDERSATVLAHKTFHRYTTRRKQGGSQSANDSAKGAAHSAGSALRRYNEAALVQDVRDVLKSWKTLIDTADLIFVRATGTTNRRTLFGPYENQVLRTNDPRNRGFPFNTRRATQKELMRAFIELTRAKTSTLTTDNLSSLPTPETQPAAPKPATPKPKPPKLSKEDEAAALHTTQTTALIKRAKIPALLSYLSTNNLSPTFSFIPANHHTPTPLHYAASLNAAPVVSALLLKAHADPSAFASSSAEGGDPSRPAFTLASDRATRDAFRTARHTLGESAWPWDTARVPPALDPSDAESRAARSRAEKQAEEKEESARRAAETERLRREGEQEEERRKEGRLGVGRRMGGVEKSAGDKREEEGRGLSELAKLRLERERRARAAEARMRGGG